MRRLSVLALVTVVLMMATFAWATNDKYYGQQYGIKQVKAPQSWERGTGSGAVIAVIDTGIDLNHEDLSAKIVPGYDFVQNNNDPQDQNDHGTHVSGIAAAVTHNGLGIAGVAPDAKLMGVRVLNQNASGSGTNINKGIRWAAGVAANGSCEGRRADVLNLSLGEFAEFVVGTSMESAINQAFKCGAVIVWSAGNDNGPSGGSGVKAIVVAATNAGGGIDFNYSSIPADADWGMAAPGTNILSSVRGNTYQNFSGTSMAAPHVSGAAAILMGMGLTNQQTVDCLLKTADPLSISQGGPAGGAGRLNVQAAVNGPSPCPAASTGGGGGSSGGTGGGGSTGSSGSGGGGSAGSGGGGASTGASGSSKSTASGSTSNSGNAGGTSASAGETGSSDLTGSEDGVNQTAVDGNASTQRQGGSETPSLFRGTDGSPGFFGWVAAALLLTTTFGLILRRRRKDAQ